MPARTLMVCTLLVGALSAAGGCAERNTSVLTLEGSYSGTSADSCQLALRNADGELVESHAVPPSFHQEFGVPPGKARYYAEVHCPDGKEGTSPGFDFEPPRSGMKLRDIELN